jgi:ribosomal protein S18
MDAYTLTRARNTEEVARKWMEYARGLEEKLAHYAANYKGLEALKNAAMKELSRIDPDNFLTEQQNRQRTLDDAIAASRKKSRT